MGDAKMTQTHFNLINQMKVENELEIIHIQYYHVVYFAVID